MAPIVNYFNRPIREINPINQKRSIIDLGMTNSPDTVLSFRVEQKPFGVSCQTCHKALITTIRARLSEKAPLTAPRRVSFGRVTVKKRRMITLAVTNRIAALNSRGCLRGYRELTDTFSAAKRSILGIRRARGPPPPPSAAMRVLQKKFSEAMLRVHKEKSDFSYFAADNLEKLVILQHKYENDRRFSTWIRKMNDLDFNNRTRAFFSKIRSRQMAEEEPSPIVDSNGILSDNLEDTLKNWTQYYRSLYTCECKPGARGVFPTPEGHEHLDRDLSLIEFVDVIYELRHYKSPGYDHIVSEDITAAIVEEVDGDHIPPCQKIILLKFIFSILSDFWFNQCVPRDLKRTILRPFLKDGDKSGSDPSNYRPISLLNTLMKIYEGIICNRVLAFLKATHFFSPFQAAYRKGRSTADHVFVIHELFLEHRFNSVGPRGGRARRALYLCFLDLRKAFDTVPRQVLFSKLYNAGIRGRMLDVIQNLFSSNPANVLIHGFLSPEFTINRGVLQGSKLGPVLFNVFINDLLDELGNSGLGAHLGPVHIPVLGFADDIVLISDDPRKLQRMIDTCYHWAARNSMSFNIPKCKVMMFNAPRDGPPFTLNGEELKVVTSCKYLGVTLTSRYVTNLFRRHYASIVERVNVRVAAICRHGFHEDGLRLSTAVRLYKLVVRPLLEYCAQTLSYFRYSQNSCLQEVTGFAKELEQLQTRVLKRLVNCPRATSPAVLRLFCGVEPLAGRLEMLKLRYFWKVLRGPSESIAHKVLKHRMDNFLGFDKGFAHEVFDICCKYNCLHFWHGNAANYKNPLNAMKRVILSQNFRGDYEVGKGRNCPFASLFLADPESRKQGYRLPEVFRQPRCFEAPGGRKRLVRVLLHPCTYDEDCTLCGQKYRDKFGHFMAVCPRIVGYRKSLFLKLRFYDFPVHRLPLSKICFLDLATRNRIWRSCLADFLEKTDF